ncbi:MAG: tetratricopeptide repeat protein [Nitrospirae bacterium]|nr:tetratricopeptide repeat protein [Nitrospirota bacterium]
MTDSGIETDKLIEKGLKALENGDTLSALVFFEKAYNIEQTPEICSYLGFCIAKERGQFSKGVALCEEAIKKEPNNSVLYLNLGRLYLFYNKKEQAVITFREGLQQEMNQMILEEFNRIGNRKPPVIPFLKRSNPINKYLGILLKKLKLR